MSETSEIHMPQQAAPQVLGSPEAAELRRLQALTLIRRYALATLAVGLIPLPLIDLLLSVVTQGRMLQKLARHYGYPFEGEQRVYSVWGAIIGGALLPLLVAPAALSLLKFLPVIGTVPGMIVLPVVLFASSYGVGRVFVQHFEGGGTLLTFDPARAHQSLRSYYEEGLRAVGVKSKERSQSERQKTAAVEPPPVAAPAGDLEDDLPLGPRATL